MVRDDGLGVQLQARRMTSITQMGDETGPGLEWSAHGLL